MPLRPYIDALFEDDQTMPGPQKLARAAAAAGWVAQLHHDTVELTNTGYGVVVDVWYDEGEPVEIRSLVDLLSTPLDHLVPILKESPQRFLRALEADALRVSGDARGAAVPPKPKAPPGPVPVPMESLLAENDTTAEPIKVRFPSLREGIWVEPVRQIGSDPDIWIGRLRNNSMSSKLRYDDWVVYGEIGDAYNPVALATVKKSRRKEDPNDEWLQANGINLAALTTQLTRHRERTVRDVPMESVLTERDDIDKLPLPRAAKAYARRSGLKSMLRQPKDFAHVNHLIFNPTWRKNRYVQHAVGKTIGRAGSGMKESVQAFVNDLLADGT